MKQLKYLALSIFSIFLIISCSSDSDEDQTQIPEYDRSTILTNYAENIIIPRYADFKLSLMNLKSSVDSYVASPMVSTFDKMHNDWLDAYKKWQHIEMFNIGKAEEIMFFNTINTYPVDELRINENIVSQKNDLSNANDYSSQGLSGVDYMIHGIDDTKDKVIQKYTDDPKYGEYLKNLLSIM